MKVIQQMALVAEVDQISSSALSRASAALQKQLSRDFGPIWDVSATIDAFQRLEDVPLTYWPILVQTDIRTPGAAGVHEDHNGQPFALVQYSNRWTLTASHEMLEMSADPFGNRLMQGRSIKPDQGRVEYLVEVADPCEAPDFAYRVNGVLVSDFYTPHFFDPAKAQGVRYSFTGAITEPRQVLRGGYLSWHDPPSDHWWQARFFSGNQPEFHDLGVLSASQGSLRVQVDALTPVPDLLEDLPEGPVLTAAQESAQAMDESSSARAERLRAQIEEIKKGASAPQ